MSNMWKTHCTCLPRVTYEHNYRCDCVNSIALMNENIFSVTWKTKIDTLAGTHTWRHSSRCSLQRVWTDFTETWMLQLVKQASPFISCRISALCWFFLL